MLKWMRCGTLGALIVDVVVDEGSLGSCENFRLGVCTAEHAKIIL